MKKWAKEMNGAVFKGRSTNGKKKKNMKKWSTFLVIKEIQIKTTLRFYLTFVIMAIIKSTNNKKCQGCREKGTLIHDSWECILV
jgi:hypothetical protein